MITLTEKDIQLINTVADALDAARTVDSGDIAPWPDNTPSLASLLANGSEPLRWELSAVAAEHAKSLPASDPVRKPLAELLTQRLEDPSDRVRQAVVRWLGSFARTDFSESDRTAILHYYQANPSSETLLLAGRIAPEALSATIDELAHPLFHPEDLDHIFGTIAWSALLLKARNGDAQSIQQTLALLEQEADLITRASRLFREITFAPRPAIADYLKRYLMSDERLESTKESAPGQPVATYAAEALSNIVVGFPIQKPYSDYTAAEIDLCRQWIARQPQLQLKDNLSFSTP